MSWILIDDPNATLLRDDIVSVARDVPQDYLDNQDNHDPKRVSSGEEWGYIINGDIGRSLRRLRLRYDGFREAVIYRNDEAKQKANSPWDLSGSPLRWDQPPPAWAVVKDNPENNWLDALQICAESSSKKKRPRLILMMNKHYSNPLPIP